MMRNPAYRLPTTTVPLRYSVILTPYFQTTPDSLNKPFSFDGQTFITIKATEPGVTEIVMHCNDLTIDTLMVTTIKENEDEEEENDEFLELTNNTFACEAPYSFLRIGLKEPLQLDQEYRVIAVYKGNLQTNMRGFYRSWYRDSSGVR